MAAAGAVLALILGALAKSKAWCPFGEFLARDGTSIYGAALSAFASILGFAIASMALVATILSTERFRAFFGSRHYKVDPVVKTDSAAI